MLKAALRRFLNRKASTAAAASVRQPVIDEPLEPRLLFSTKHGVGPVIAQQFIGDIKHVTALVLYFDPATPLDPASASSTDSYRLVKKSKSKDDPDASDVFFGDDGSSSTHVRRIKLESATYDPAANTVTIKPVAESFEIGRDYTVTVVDGTGANPLKMADGSVIDGDLNGKPGGDLNIRYKANPRTALSFKDADGDVAKLRVKGGGRLFYFLPTLGRSAPSIFLRDTTASTILSGTVKQGKHGDGIVNIAQITDNDDADIATITLTNPPFNIRPIATVV
jgi:hypothetical protein